MIPNSDPVTGGRAVLVLFALSDITNSLNICETDLPRCAACAFACIIRTSSIRNVSFVFMPYNVSQNTRLVNDLFAICHFL